MTSMRKASEFVWQFGRHKKSNVATTFQFKMIALIYVSTSNRSDECNRINVGSYKNFLVWNAHESAEADYTNKVPLLPIHYFGYGFNCLWILNMQIQRQNVAAQSIVGIGGTR